MFDVVLNNGLLIDPESKTPSVGSIGIREGRIAAVSPAPLTGKRTVDVRGYAVSPGWIDAHTHTDGNPRCAELLLCQGVTTAVSGNCGLSPFDIKAFFDRQDENGFLLHQAEYIGHSFTLRGAVGLRSTHEPASPNQIAEMERLAEQALLNGACGISFGLDYAPGSSFDEVLALSRTAAKYGRTISVHTRMKTAKDLDSVREVVRIGRMTGVRIIISHFVYQYGEGIMDDALKLVDDARRDGLDLFIDSGMYTPWATSIGTATYDESNISTNNWKADDMLVASGKYTGKRLDRTIYRELRTKSPNECVIYFVGQDKDIYKALRKPYAMPSSDAAQYAPGEGHPQIAGTFPRYFRKMVRERGDLALPEAIRKATLLPAQVFGLPGKGSLRIGADADLTVFDPGVITDKANFPDRGRPDALPEGIHSVFLNGTEVVTNGAYNGKAKGKSIRF